MATTLEIIQGLKQAQSNAYDGAIDKDGKKIDSGLKRDQEHPMSERRFMDGFKVKFSGNNFYITYQAEVLQSDVHDKKFETNVKQTIADVVSYLKKEYKNITGNSVTLKPIGEPQIQVQSTSRVRNWVQVLSKYEIGGIDLPPQSEPIQDKLDKAVKDWMETGKPKHAGAKKPENDSRKEEKSEGNMKKPKKDDK